MASLTSGGMPRASSIRILRPVLWCASILIFCFGVWHWFDLPDPAKAPEADSSTSAPQIHALYFDGMIERGKPDWLRGGRLSPVPDVTPKEDINPAGDALGTAEALSLLCRHSEAIAFLKREIERKSDDPGIQDRLGLAYQWAGEYDLAAESYRRALELNPRMEAAAIHLGNGYFQMGRYREALHEFDRCIRLASSPRAAGRAYGALAWTLWNMGDRTKAEEAAAMEARAPSEVNAAFNLALANGQADRAAQLAELSSEGTGGAGQPLLDRSHYYRLGRLSFRNRKHEEGIRQFRLALGQVPLIRSLEPLEDCLADAYLEIGWWDQAVDEYRRVIGLIPNYPRAHYRLALALQARGEKAAARAEFKRFLELWSGADPDAPQLLNAKRRIQMLGA
jgi:tetratricopeptide (TPR) repeat protein